jgi:hypothetical protein
MFGVTVKSPLSHDPPVATVHAHAQAAGFPNGPSSASAGAPYPVEQLGCLISAYSTKAHPAGMAATVQVHPGWQTGSAQSTRPLQLSSIPLSQISVAGQPSPPVPLVPSTELDPSEPGPVSPPPGAVVTSVRPAASSIDPPASTNAEPLSPRPLESSPHAAAMNATVPAARTR